MLPMHIQTMTAATMPPTTAGAPLVLLLPELAEMKGRNSFKQKRTNVLEDYT